METVYIEATIVSYLVCNPSQDVIVGAHQKLTRQWWDWKRSFFTCFISDVVLDEAGDGDPQQAALRLRALKGIPKLAATAGRRTTGCGFSRR